MGLIGVKGFTGERKEKINEALEFLKDHSLQKAFAFFSFGLDPSFEYKKLYS